MTMAKHDWRLVRIQYVQGKDSDSAVEWPTLEQLAHEYGIPPTTVRSRAARENWKAQREECATILKQKTVEKTLLHLADKASQLDVQAFSVARGMFVVAARRLNQSMTEDGTSLTLAEQERLLRICDLAHRIGRRALGIGITSD